MGNRTIQAKINKMKRYKRLAPRKYYADQVSVHMPRKPEFFGNPRTLYLGGTSCHREAELRARNAMFMAMYPSFCIDPNTNEPYKDNDPRRLVKQRVYELIDDDIPLQQNVVLKRSKYYECLFYFNTGYTKCFFIEEDKVGEFIRRSANYGSRERAMIAYRYKQIRWGEPIEKLPPEASPPLTG